MSKVLDYRTTKVQLVPLATLTSVSAPSLALVTGVGAFDISQQILPTSKLPAYGADKTVTEGAITDGEDIVAIIGGSYGGELDMFHDFTTGAVFSSTDLTTIFTGPGLQWAVVIRSGLPWDTALAAAQKVSVYPVSSGRVQEMRSFNGYLKAKIALYPLGGAKENVALAA